MALYEKEPKDTENDGSLRRPEYRVSTITCNASLAVNVNLSLFFEHVLVQPNEGFVWVEYGRNTRGIYPKKRKDAGATKKCFDNQATIIYKMSSTLSNTPDYYPNIKVFRNGSIQMTGIRTYEDGERAALVVAQEIERMRHVATVVDTSIAAITSKDFVIRMINCDFGMPYKIKRKKLHILLTSAEHNNSCSFQPVDYPGVKLQYFWNTDPRCSNQGVCMCDKQCFGKGSGHGPGQCKKVTVSIFDSGKILITGANSFHQVNAAYKYIHQVITSNEDDLKKIVPCLS